MTAAFVHPVNVTWADCDPAKIAYTARLPYFALDAINRADIHNRNTFLPAARDQREVAQKIGTKSMQGYFIEMQTKEYRAFSNIAS